MTCTFPECQCPSEDLCQETPAAAPAPAAPQGWKLVPIEPTKAMQQVQTWDFNRFYSPKEIWQNMLATTPSPAPAQEVGLTDEQTLKDAFQEGYWARETYNDSEVSDFEDKWARSDAKAAIISALHTKEAGQ